MWAKYAIYEAIDKIPQICRDLQIWGQAKFGKFDITSHHMIWLNYTYIYLSIIL